MRAITILLAYILIGTSMIQKTSAAVPSRTPTRRPSHTPTYAPSSPSSRPSSYPTSRPTSSEPTLSPTGSPFVPSYSPSYQPSFAPANPTGQPTNQPSSQPTSQPSRTPTITRSAAPTISHQPTSRPSSIPTCRPTSKPTSQPTMTPTYSQQPSARPTDVPSSRPTSPSGQPTSRPTKPSGQPTRQPTGQPTSQPIGRPSRHPTSQPTDQPTGQPTRKPSIPSGQPSSKPSSQPSSQPTSSPIISRQPSSEPSSHPTKIPSGQPSSRPTSGPTVSPQPTSCPTSLPSAQPSSKPTQEFATSQPTSQNFRTVVTGVVKFLPLNTALCSPIELDIFITFSRTLIAGDYFIVDTPGLTSGVCSIPYKGGNINSLLTLSNCSVTAKYLEGSPGTNYVTSKINFTAGHSIAASESYLIRVDQSNGLKRTCSRNTTWGVFLENAQLQGELSIYNNQPTACFQYSSSLSFFPASPQLSITINFTFFLPFSLAYGDYITVHLPGFSNKIADYPLNGMISPQSTSSFIGAGNNSNILNITESYNDTALKWSTPYGWTGKWLEGGYRTGNESRLILRPQGFHALNVPIWVVIDGYENHIVSLVGRPRNYSGFTVDIFTEYFTLNKTSVHTSTAIGSGCDAFNECSGNGNCNYTRGRCECFDGFGSAADLKNVLQNNYSPDCSSRTCPKGPASVALPKFPTQGYHQPTECSNNGMCSRVTGVCTCFKGYNGAACEKMTCPGQPVCSGRGLCYSIMQLSAVSTAVPLRTEDASYVEYVNKNYNVTSNSSSYDANRGRACVCDSSWIVGLGSAQTQLAEFFGPACQLRHCPSGDDPNTVLDETNCTGIAQTPGGMSGLIGNLCHVDCSHRGLCNLKTGICACFEGYTGVACSQRSKGVRARVSG